MDREITLYQVKALSRRDSVVDWQALAAKVPAGQLTASHKTNCSLKLPEESIPELEALLAREYRNVHWTFVQGPRPYSSNIATLGERVRTRR